MRILIALVAAALLLPRDADACSPSNDHPGFAIDPAEQAVDVEPPGQVRIRETTVLREVDPALNDSWGDAGECSTRIGTNARLTIEIDGAVDDRTPLDRMGYRLEILEGSWPGRMPPGDEVLPVWPDETLRLGWDEEDDDPIRMVLRLVPVDRAGNEGPPSEPVEVRNEGVGCSSAGGSGVAGLLIAGLALLGRRR